MTERVEVDVATVLGKAVLVLQAFTADDHLLSLSELVRRTGLAKGTVHRVVGNLVDVRLVDRTERGYRLSAQMFELGMRASVERSLLEVATPFMEDVYERTRETVHLGVREGLEVIYVAKIGGHRQASAPSRVGGRMPLHCTAIGKALLAFSAPEVFAELVSVPLARRTPRTVIGPGILRGQLEQVRASGVAFEYEESAVGLVCVGAPVLNSQEQSIAALSATGPVTRFHPYAYAATVRAAAAGIAATLARREALVVPPT